VPTHWRAREYPLSTGGQLPANTQVIENRYRVPFAPWRRYTSGDTETPYAHERPYLWHPYFQSVLKGDSPIIGPGHLS
jgi:hypothetical protein